MKLTRYVGSMRKMEQAEEICKSLEGLDCGSCGAPSCRALAEDVVRGLATVDDCVFRFKEKNGYVPAPFRSERPDDGQHPGKEETT